MDLLLTLVLGLIAGVAIGNAVGTVRAARRRRPQNLAVDAELQAARQRAERVAGEAQALRAKLATADVLTARVAELEVELAAAYEDAERNAELASRLESEIAALRTGRRSRAAVPDAAGTRRSGTMAAPREVPTTFATATAPTIPSVPVPVAVSEQPVIVIAEPVPPALPEADEPFAHAASTNGAMARAVPPPAAEPSAPAMVVAAVIELKVVDPGGVDHAVEQATPSLPPSPSGPAGAMASAPHAPAAAARIAPVRAQRAASLARPAGHGSTTGHGSTAGPDEPPSPVGAPPMIAVASEPDPRATPASVTRDPEPAQAAPMRTRPRSQPAPAVTTDLDLLPPLDATPDPVAVAPDPVAVVPDPVAVAPDPVAVAPDPVAVAPAPHPHGWQALRPGLADPWTWLSTTSPAGMPYAEDDLQRIHGVGPYLARRLREEGVLTWRQVAEWDEDDMALASRRIGTFPDRIRREDWSGAARELHQATYGERLP